MTQNVDRETVVSRLLAADDILILCHKNPDGDTCLLYTSDAADD